MNGPIASVWNEYRLRTNTAIDVPDDFDKKLTPSVIIGFR